MILTTRATTRRGPAPAISVHATALLAAASMTSRLGVWAKIGDCAMWIPIARVAVSGENANDVVSQ
jgi:hypothetical protein